jgi:hypothetical protein
VRLGTAVSEWQAIDTMERMYARVPGTYYVLDVNKNEVVAFLPNQPQ